MGRKDTLQERRDARGPLLPPEIKIEQEDIGLGVRGQRQGLRDGGGAHGVVKLSV